MKTRRKHTVRSVEYMAWQNMRQRCMNPKFRQYADYGGRGITICAQWQGPGGFSVFLRDVGVRPSEHHTLDRENNELGYQPGNVRWATRRQQNNNTSKNVRLSANGEILTIAQWCARTGLKHSTIRSRIARGWPADVAATTPLRAS